MEALSREAILPYLRQVKALSDVELHDSATKNASLIVSLAEDGHAKAHAYFAYGLALKSAGEFGRALRALQDALREAVKVNYHAAESLEWGVGDIAETDLTHFGEFQGFDAESKSENDIMQLEDDTKKRRRRNQQLFPSTSYGRFIGVVKFRLALCHVSLRKIEAAISVLETISREFCPGAATALLGKLKRRVRAKGAMVTLKAAAAQVPFAIELPLALLEMEADIDDVIATLSDAKALPVWMENLLRAHGAYNLHRPREAAQRFAHLNSTFFPGNAHILTHLARAEAQSGQRDAALVWFARAHAAEPLNMEGVGEYAATLKQAAAKVKLAQLTHEVLNNTKDLDIHEEAWVAAAHLGDLQGEDEKALSYAQRALERAPHNLAALHLRGSLLLDKHPLESLACYANALCIRRDLDGLRGLAEAYLAMKPPRLGDALQVAKEAVNLVPYDARSYVIMARALGAHPMTESLAAEALLRALKIEPTNAQASVLLSEIRSSQFERGECSSAQLKETTSILTVVMQDRGQARDRLHCQIGKVYALTGDNVRALEHFHHALSINANCEEARNGLHLLENQRYRTIPSSAHSSSNRSSYFSQQISPAAQRRSPGLRMSGTSSPGSPDISPQIRRRRT